MGPPQPRETQLANGEQHRELLGSRGLIDRVEYIRVLEQALRALGYEDVAEALETASGVVQQPPVAAAFRAAVLEGEYDTALRLLPAVAADERVADRARFLLLRAKYIELMEAGATPAALQVLRQELQPLHVQQQVLHSLAALLLRSPVAASNGASPGAAGGAGADQLPEGRAALLEELQDSLLPSLLIPERRLEVLVEQALLAQLEGCAYFNSRATHLSLFTDFQAGAEQLPTQPGQVLEEHTSEVWSIAFSRDGLLAASASKDGSALLWSVSPGGRLESPRLLVRQPVPCQLVCFSPDSRLLLTASMDATVRLHDAAAGKQLRQFVLANAEATQAASAAAAAGAAGAGAAGAAAAGATPAAASSGPTVMALSWFPDSRRFLVATHRGLAVYDAQQAGGAPLRRLPCAHSYVYDALVGPGGGCVISVGQDKRIAFTRLSDLRVEVIPESGAVTSIHLSPCGRFLTANLSDSLVHVWQLPAGLAGAAGAAGSNPAAEQPLAHALLAANVAAGVLNSTAHAGGGGSAGLVGSPAADPFDALPSAPAHELRMAGAKPSRYVLRSCVGGAASGFVAGGAEDCRLYIWSRRSGELLECLGGHSGCINATAWHPTNPWLLASASDDGTIRTWLAPSALPA